MKRIVIATLLALVVAVATMVLAQQGPPPRAEQRMQHHIEFLTEALSLSPAQQQQATAIFTNAKLAEEASRSSMNSAHDALQSAIRANDPGAIDAAAKTIANLMAQSIAARAKAQAAFYAILTPEQQSKRAVLGGPGMYRMGYIGVGHGGSSERNGPAQ